MADFHERNLNLRRTLRYFSALTAECELLCQNDENISPSIKPYGFYENTVSTIGSLWRS